MLFARRTPPNWKEKMRVALWPRRSWGRSTSYILKRLSRLRTSPHAIALGAAMGALVSFTPFIGLHFLLGIFLAWVLRASVVASVFGTFIGNPLTFPIIWLVSYKAGVALLGLEAELDSNGLIEQLGVLKQSIVATSPNLSVIWEALYSLWPNLLKPMIVGGLPIGVVVSAVLYYSIRKLAQNHQQRRNFVPA